MTITGAKVMTKIGKAKDETRYLTITLTDGETVDVCRTSDPTSMIYLEDLPMGEMVTLCITQSVYKEKIYNKINSIKDF